MTTSNIFNPIEVKDFNLKVLHESQDATYLGRKNDQSLTEGESLNLPEETGLSL